MRRLVTVLTALVVVAGLLGLPAMSGAATTVSGVSTNPFSLGVPASSGDTATATTTTAVTSSTSTSTNGSFGTIDVVIIGGVVVLIIVGVALFVMRDSRATARNLDQGRHGSGGVNDTRHAGSKTPPKPRKLSAQEKKRRKRGRAPRRK